MGVVYRATHIALDHVVALKVISPELAQDERFRRRFGEESRIAVSIRHPNVVPIHHAGEEDGLLFVTMDLIDGSDLRGLLREHGTLEPQHAAAIVAEVASALDAAHERGLVHRDIKPGNILIEHHDTERVFLTDFGLARQVEASTGVTATGAFVGTLDYVAPEQIRGERVDARSDVYALGCVLFELLTGNPPFAARDDKVAKMYAHLEEEPPSLRVLRPDLPGGLDQVIGRALAKDPAERYPSAGDLSRAVWAAIEGQATVEAERSVATGAAAPALAAAAVTAEVTPSEPATAAPEPPDEPASMPTELTSPPADRPVPPSRPTVAREPPPRRKHTGRIAVVAAGALAVAVAAAVVLTGGGDSGTDTNQETAGGTQAGGGGSNGGGQPAKAKVVATVTGVGGLPVELAHGEGGVWVTSRNGDQVTYIDAAGKSQEIAARFPVGSAPEGLALAAGSVYVAIGDENTVKRLNVGEGAITKTIPGFTKPQGVAFGVSSVWVTDFGSDELVQINPITGEILDRTPVGDGPYGIAFDSDAVWISNRLGGTVSRVPLDGGAPEQFEVGAGPKGVAVAGGFVWVAVTDDGVVKQLKPDGSEVRSIEVGAEPRGAVAGFGSVWVALGGENEVVRIDEESGEIIDRIAVGAGPEGITAGPESVWVANGIEGSVSRIDPSP